MNTLLPYILRCDLLLWPSVGISLYFKWYKLLSWRTTTKLRLCVPFCRSTEAHGTLGVLHPSHFTILQLRTWFFVRENTWETQESRCHYQNGRIWGYKEDISIFYSCVHELVPSLESTSISWVQFREHLKLRITSIQILSIEIVVRSFITLWINLN